MPSSLKRCSQAVERVVNQFGLQAEVVEFAASTRTAQQAADAIGCTVSQIAKSIVFKSKESQKPILVVASGSNRVNEKALTAYVGEKLEKADAAFVLEETGFVIGGVAPVGHKYPITTFIDEDLMQYEEIWASAGTPNTVFRLTPQILATVTGAKIICIR